LAGDYSEYKAQANADELLLEKSEDLLHDLETDFAAKTGYNFNDIESHEELLEN
jgi:hypothetical protein